MKGEFSGQIFEKNIQISNFIKVGPVGSELFHADSGQAGIQTDRPADLTTLIVTFRNFVNGLKTSSRATYWHLTTYSLYYSVVS